MSKIFFYRCPVCGSVVFAFAEASPACCGRDMEILKDTLSGGAVDRHLPDARMEDGVLKVTVGINLHPSLPEHRIEWVFAETVSGGEFRFFGPGEEPRCVFSQGTKVKNVYAFCNLHGLWKCMKT